MANRFEEYKKAQKERILKIAAQLERHPMMETIVYTMHVMHEQLKDGKQTALYTELNAIAKDFYTEQFAYKRTKYQFAILLGILLTVLKDNIDNTDEDTHGES